MSFDISSRHERLSKRLFVEASAGTGKTFVIEHYLVRSILTSPFNPEKLALITFTKAVARELRLRLRATLQKTLAAIAEGESAHAPDYLQPVLEQDSFCRNTSARTIEEAMQRLPSATISTIHGFCDRLLRGWGEETGGNSIEEWMGEEEKKQWLTEFLQEGAGLRGGELEVVSKRYSHDQDKLIAHLLRLMDDVEGKDDRAWEEAEEAIFKMRGKGAKIAEVLAKKAMGYRGNTKKDGTLKKEIAMAFEAIESIVEKGMREGRLEPLYDFSLPRCFATPLAKKVVLPAEEEWLVDLIVTNVWPALQELVDGECIVRRLASRSAKAFLAFVLASGKKTPDMVVRRVLELSTDERFLAFAASAVEWLVVDEFQDTDALQYAIFSRLFLDNTLWHGHVLFVGDPKQAIYGFRKADVYSYLAAKEALLPHEIRTLAVNYRAQKDVVEAQNRLFAGPEHPWVFYLPRAKTSLHVVPCEVGKKLLEAIGDRRGALHLFVARHHLGRRRRWPHEEMEQEGLFPWIADEMIDLQGRGIAFQNQAVLVKDRYQARRVQQFLGGRGIPTCAWRVDAVTDSPIYSWLQKAFSLAIRPNDPRRLSALLLDMPTDYHLQLCHDMASNRRLDQWAACATAWTYVKEAFQEGGVAGMARALFSCRWNGRDTVEEWLHTMPQGDDLLIDLEHLFELLFLLDPVLPHSMEAYGDALAHLTSHFSEDIQTLTRRVDPDDEGVPILTMHRSKGLEFDIVYALGCSSRTPLQDEIAVDEADAEKLRQLYVAITRAKRRCYLPLLVDDDEKAVPQGQASPAELLFAALSSRGVPSSAWTSSLYQSMSGAESLQCASRLCHDLPHAITMSEVALEERAFSVARKQKTPSPTTSLLPPSWRSRSYRSFSSEEDGSSFPSTSGQSATAWSTLSSTSQTDPKENSAATSLPGERENVGVRFHGAISRLLFAPPETRASIQSVSEWLKKEGEDDPQMAQLLFDAVRVRLPMGKEMVCLEEVPRGDMRVECAFLDKADGDRYIRGVLDLVLLWNKAVYVIDWKTHDVEGGQCRRIVEEEYERQHTIYREAVVRAFTPEYRYGGFFFVFVRHLQDGGIVADCGGGDGQ